MLEGIQFKVDMILCCGNIHGLFDYGAVETGP